MSPGASISRGRRYTADFRAGCERQYRLCGGMPNCQRQGILVPAIYDDQTIADLKGKRIRIGKGTSAHNVLIATFGKAGLLRDITPFICPPRMRAGLCEWQH